MLIDFDVLKSSLVCTNPCLSQSFPRDNSPLDKVFDYFSNRTAEDGSRQMCPHALLNAIVPTFPPSKSHTDRAGSLAGM